MPAGRSPFEKVQKKHFYKGCGVKMAVLIFTPLVGQLSLGRAMLLCGHVTRETDELAKS